MSTLGPVPVPVVFDVNAQRDRRGIRGRITDPPQVVGDCPDWEDNRVLDLAVVVGAFLVVSADRKGQFRL